MIDYHQDDFAVWKQASQTRELCEEKENRLRQARNIWLTMAFISLSAVTLLMIPVFQSGSTGPESDEMLLFHPAVKWILAGISLIMAIAAVLYILRVSSAKTRSEQARNDEWTTILDIHRSLFK